VVKLWDTRMLCGSVPFLPFEEDEVEDNGVVGQDDNGDDGEDEGGEDERLPSSRNNRGNYPWMTSAFSRSPMASTCGGACNPGAPLKISAEPRTNRSSTCAGICVAADLAVARQRKRMTVSGTGLDTLRPLKKRRTKRVDPRRRRQGQEKRNQTSPWTIRPDTSLRDGAIMAEPLLPSSTVVPSSPSFLSSPDHTSSLRCSAGNGKAHAIVHLARDPSSNRLAVSTADGRLLIVDGSDPSLGVLLEIGGRPSGSHWSTTGDQPQVHHHQVARNFYISFDWSPDGRYLASGSADHHVYIYDTHTYDRGGGGGGGGADEQYAPGVVRLRGHEMASERVAWSRTEPHQLASSEESGVVRLWSVRKGVPGLKRIAERCPPTGVRWVAGGRRRRRNGNVEKHDEENGKVATDAAGFRTIRTARERDLMQDLFGAESFSGDGVIPCSSSSSSSSPSSPSSPPPPSEGEEEEETKRGPPRLSVWPPVWGIDQHRLAVVNQTGRSGRGGGSSVRAREVVVAQSTPLTTRYHPVLSPLCFSKPSVVLRQRGILDCLRTIRKLPPLEQGKRKDQDDSRETTPITPGGGRRPPGASPPQPLCATHEDTISTTTKGKITAYFTRQ